MRRRVPVHRVEHLAAHAPAGLGRSRAGIAPCSSASATGGAGAHPRRADRRRPDPHARPRLGGHHDRLRAGPRPTRRAGACPRSPRRGAAIRSTPPSTCIVAEGGKGSMILFQLDEDDVPARPRAPARDDRVGRLGARGRTARWARASRTRGATARSRACSVATRASRACSSLAGGRAQDDGRCPRDRLGLSDRGVLRAGARGRPRRVRRRAGSPTARPTRIRISTPRASSTSSSTGASSSSAASTPARCRAGC